MPAVTLADLNDQDVPLLIGCLNCGRHVHQSAASLSLPQSEYQSGNKLTQNQLPYENLTPFWLIGR
jgi:hypothetical protein